MPVILRPWLVPLFLAFAVFSSATALTPASTVGRVPVYDAPQSYYRTELYFGRSIPNGGIVSDEQWEEFLLQTVTPRFPDGFTVFDARGQYRQQDGQVAKEPTKVLIFLYSAKARTASRRKIEEIRRAYVRQFRQESVLRVDLPSRVRVSF